MPVPRITQEPTCSRDNNFNLLHHHPCPPVSSTPISRRVSDRYLCLGISRLNGAGTFLKTRPCGKSTHSRGAYTVPARSRTPAGSHAVHCGNNSVATVWSIPDRAAGRHHVRDKLEGEAAATTAMLPMAEVATTSRRRMASAHHRCRDSWSQTRFRLAYRASVSSRGRAFSARTLHARSRRGHSVP